MITLSSRCGRTRRARTASSFSRSRARRSAAASGATPNRFAASASGWRREEAPLRRREVARDVGQDPARGRGVGGGARRVGCGAGLARDLVRVEVRPRELRLVVQHLLEMRHQPFGVGGIAVESATDLIVDAARLHRVELPARHLQRRRAAIGIARPVAREEIEVRDRRELGCCAEAAVPAIEATLERLRTALEQRFALRPPRGLGARRDPRAPALRRGRGDRLEHARALRLDVAALPRPHLVHARQDFHEARPSRAGILREVGAAVERLELGREEHVERPAAAHAHRLHRGHVQPVHVRTLLAVDLHRHEPAVEQCRHRIVLERLVLHDVAPVAGGIADREEDRLPFAPRLLESFIAPRVPVHGVPGVLQQVGALFVDEPVGLAAGIRFAHGSRFAACLARAAGRVGPGGEPGQRRAGEEHSHPSQPGG